MKRTHAKTACIGGRANGGSAGVAACTQARVRVSGGTVASCAAAIARVIVRCPLFLAREHRGELRSRIRSRAMESGVMRDRSACGSAAADVR